MLHLILLEAVQHLEKDSTANSAFRAFFEGEGAGGFDDYIGHERGEDRIDRQQVTPPYSTCTVVLGYTYSIN